MLPLLTVTLASSLLSQPRYLYTAPCVAGDQACLAAATAFEKVDALYPRAIQFRLGGDTEQINADLQAMVAVLNQMRRTTEAVVASGHPLYSALAFARLGMAFDAAAKQVTGLVVPVDTPDPAAARRTIGELSANLTAQAKTYLTEAGARTRRLKLDNAVTAPALLRAIALGLIPPD